MEEMDSIFWVNEKTHLEKIKTAVKSIMEDGDFHLFLRKKDYLVVTFSIENKGLDPFREVEFNWRHLWQFIADQRISIKIARVNISDQNHSFPALLSDGGQQEKGCKASSQNDLPISINSFGEESSDLNLGIIEKTIQKWFRISSDDKYKPVLHGIRRALQNKNKMVDTIYYVSLVAEIETFLDIQGEKNTVDRLVELYADQDWKDGFMEFGTCKSEKETIGKWFHEIRNVIVHPKSGKKKSGGKYWRVASDPFQLQKAYAHLSGLYLKAILLSLGGINPDHIDEYTRKYILNRASHKPVAFE